MGQIEITKCLIEGLYIIEPNRYQNGEECFVEIYNKNKFHKAGIKKTFVQENQSMSTKGVIRGLHLQKMHPQGKLVRVIQGEVFDVAVDLRSNSPTFCDWYGVVLSGDNRRQFYIPEGFAHGFYVMSEVAEFSYKVTNFWNPNDEIGIPWNDSAFGIEWPIEDGEMPILAEKDKKYPKFDKSKW